MVFAFVGDSTITRVFDTGDEATAPRGKVSTRGEIRSCLPEPAAVSCNPMLESSQLVEDAVSSVQAMIAESDASMQQIVECLHESSGGVLLPTIYRRRGDRLWLEAIAGYSGMFDGASLRGGIMARAIKTSEVQRLEDVSLDADFVQVKDEVASELAVPFGEFVVNIESTLPLDDAAMESLERLARSLVERIGSDPAPMTPARALSPLASIEDPEMLAAYLCEITHTLLELSLCQVVIFIGDRAVSQWRASPGTDDRPLSPEELLDVVGDKERYYSWVGARPFEVEHWSTCRDVFIVPVRANGELVGGIVGGANELRATQEVADILASISTQVSACLDRIELERSLNAALSARTEFTASVSHELRTPLTAILGYSDLLLDGAAYSEQENREFLSQIRQGAGHLLAIVNDLLDTARAEAGTLRVSMGHAISLRQLCKEVSSYLEPTARKAGCTIDVDIPIDVVARGDPMRVRQIVMNLMSNAIKFAPGGHIRVMATDTGPDAILEVVDDGVGIDVADAGSLFRPFSGRSVHDPASGTGLGLVISRHLAHAMGGNLELFSEGRGKGSTARLTLGLWKP